ncbi:centrosomal protein of 295 kDa [Tiliqua scincoides]|uniref:centrosomal protein of 295 kDa n=1 Tax=Tiliqua scincoides TaxID=71010 RepID=UPI0034628B0D
MKRKVAKSGRLRLSPNEEALLLKEEHERRRKLRLQQVREQERNIALQIRQDIKQRRDEQLRQLAKELKAEWRKAQDEKIKALEKLYLSSLRTIGEGHRQAKENEPDLEALAKQAVERKQRAEKRHKAALKEQRNEKEKLQREQTWRVNARKHALDIEKERAAKIASLPPPPPEPFEIIELKNVPTVKAYEDDHFSQTRHHLFDPYVDKEMDVEQPDARLLAEEEVKRQEKLQNEEERDRREQLEKANLRGKHALKMVRLARDREKLMQELEQMRNQDLARRRRIVAQMPPQLFVPPYRRTEIKEEWQRELECAFEDMYTGDRKMKGDLILHVDPQPLPAFSDHSQDDELELSQEPDSVCEVPPKLGDEVKDHESGGSEVEKTLLTHSKLPLTKLLNKIRNQKNHWTSRCEAETPSEIGTIESGTLSGRGRRLGESESEHEPSSDLVSDVKVAEVLDQTVVAGNVVPSHPQEQATEIRKETERQNRMEWLEQQKQQQLTLLQQIEEQKIRLEVDFLKARLQQQQQEEAEKDKRAQRSQMPQMNDTCPVVQQEVEHQAETATEAEVAGSSTEDDHIQMIRDYQQRLLMQNRIHKESVDRARRRLLEYQNKLKQRYSSASAGLLNHVKKPAQWNSIPESPLQLQGFDVLQRVNQSLYPPSKNASVQEFTESAEGLLKEPSEQKNKEQIDVGGGRRVQPVCSQVEHTSSQLSQTSCPQTEKLAVEEIPVTRSMEFQDTSESFMLKSQDTSVTSQPVAPTQHVRFNLSPENSSESSEALWPEKSETHTPLEKNLLPNSLLKQQHLPTESKTRTSDPACLPHFQPLYSLPTSVNRETGGTQECVVIKNGAFSSSDIIELRDRMLASSESIQAQQEHLKELQEQLDQQREALLSRQRIQEELLMQKHSQLKQQMEQQQEALKDILKRAGQSSACTERTPTQETDSFNSVLSKEANGHSQEDVYFTATSNHAENILFQSIGSAEQMEPYQNPWEKEGKWRTSKPPLTKVKLGLNLEQHELSVIPELDTPRSGRLSAPGYTESFAGDTFLTSDVSEMQSSRHPTDSLHEEPDIVGIAPDAKEQSSSESLISQLSESWYEKLLMDAGGLREEVHLKDPTVMDQHLPSTSVDLGRRIAMDFVPSFRPNSMVALTAPWSPASLSSPASNQEAACSYLSSFTISTDSFISSDNPGRSFASTGMCSAQDQPRHPGCPTEEKANHTWDSSVSQLSKQDEPSEAPDSFPSFGETVHSSRSKFQQLIDKYTRDFSWSSLSNVSSQDPSFGLDSANTEENFPNFHHELSQVSEKNLGFVTISPLSRIFHDAKDFSKSSDLSKNHELSASSSEGKRNRQSFLNAENLSNPLQMEQIGKETREQIQETEDFFQPLPVESILSDFSQSADEPGNFSVVPEQNLETRESVETDTRISPDTLERRALERDEANISTHSPIEHFRSPSLSPVEDQGSFYQLLPDYGAMKNVLEIRCSVKENMASEQNLCFVELPVASADQNCEMVTENMTASDDLELDLSRCTLHTVEEKSFLGTDTMCLPQELNPEVSISPGKNSGQQNDCVPDTWQQPHLNSRQAQSSGSFVSQSSIPVWETQTGQGIMEEPELTLISSSDISTVESDLELFSQGDCKKEQNENLPYRDHCEIKCCPKSGEFLPLHLEVDDTTSIDPDNDPSVAQSPKEGSLTQKHKPTEFTSDPESLQESFLKRKKDFIERSSKRLEKLKSRERCIEEPNARASQQKKKQLYKLKENLPPPGLPINVKKVEEVKVHSADDRKTAEIQMYQRTTRLYNNLSEVKVRKKERDRQETYTRNRERAKEFQKKTLEKLRTKKTC